MKTKIVVVLTHARYNLNIYNIRKRNPASWDSLYFFPKLVY
jgi:hypothetical protein